MFCPIPELQCGIIDSLILYVQYQNQMFLLLTIPEVSISTKISPNTRKAFTTAVEIKLRVLQLNPTCPSLFNIFAAF